ncbi:UvrD-helicase domain-containing protein [Rhodopseudomonas sp. G2_2311]|uniref:UvrD-helicase domain-containing protein n=1 Tax=Rhodopseudomonas sp. G2_2311 TaxID=3114287 RepID=UPI0039C67B8D
MKDAQLYRVPGVSGVPTGGRLSLVRQHTTPLVDMLGDDYGDTLLEGLPRRMVVSLSRLDGNCTGDELDSLLDSVAEPTKGELLRKVFCLLLEGNVDGAKAHIDLSSGRMAPVEVLGEHEILEVSDGEDVRRIKVGSAEYEEWMRAFERRSAWHDWFLFLHPEQEAVVNADYPGTSQLSGVSGSGKTCVAVRRALRLAKNDDSKVLLLTLNRSLAGLLNQLVDTACPDQAIPDRIVVTSFFELAQSMLAKLEPANQKLYADVTWKLSEHVDEIFREYYRCWANNHDAAPILPLHKSMNARNVSGETYVREEFDWIRSAVQPDGRQAYLPIDRKGRKFPVVAERRSDLLFALAGWEAKMRAVGVIDYLGLTSALAAHVGQIGPQYTNILVDEAQDFGTTELSIVRLLVPPGPNDIFLCGDVAQTVLPKHRSLSDAGLKDVVRERIRRNYRNSREILSAAYELLRLNLHDELFESGDLEVLDPQFANFTGPAPMALSGVSLEQEIAFARCYARTHLDRMGTRNICIAFAGFSSRDVHEYAKHCGVTALDGAYDPSADTLVFSDLEQTKGYEFDVLIVVNCCEDVLPAGDAPEEEQFRDICKLYVCMTRAKRELVLSFHGAASRWLQAVSDTIQIDHWSSVETCDPNFLQSVPAVLPQADPNRFNDNDVWSLPGREFLYTKEAVGLSTEAQDKLIELVDGRGAIRGGSGRRLKWQSVGQLMADLIEHPRNVAVLGGNVVDELRSKFDGRSVGRDRHPIRREILTLPSRKI